MSNRELCKHGRRVDGPCYECGAVVVDRCRLANPDGTACCAHCPESGAGCLRRIGLPCPPCPADCPDDTRRAVNPPGSDADLIRALKAERDRLARVITQAWAALGADEPFDDAEELVELAAVTATGLKRYAETIDAQTAVIKSQGEVLTALEGYPATRAGMEKDNG